MIDEKTIQRAFDDFDHSAKAAGLMGGGGAGVKATTTSGSAGAQSLNLCATWKAIRPGVDVIIGILKPLAFIFPVLLRVISVLETMKELLDKMCP